MYCDAEEAVEATKMPTEARVLWGPVTKQVADAIGVPTAVASVLLRPSSAKAEAAVRMEALVPVNILPTTGDNPKSLVARLAESEYLHPKSVLSRGNGTGQRKYIDLNSTHYAQPRRVQWGAPMKVRRPQDEHESSSVRLPCYPHSYARSPLDTTCEVVMQDAFPQHFRQASHNSRSPTSCPRCLKESASSIPWTCVHQHACRRLPS